MNYAVKCDNKPAPITSRRHGLAPVHAHVHAHVRKRQRTFTCTKSRMSRRTLTFTCCETALWLRQMMIMLWYDAALYRALRRPNTKSKSLVAKPDSKQAADNKTSMMNVPHTHIHLLSRPVGGVLAVWQMAELLALPVSANQLNEPSTLYTSNPRTATRKVVAPEEAANIVSVAIAVPSSSTSSCMACVGTSGEETEHEERYRPRWAGRLPRRHLPGRDRRDLLGDRYTHGRVRRSSSPCRGCRRTSVTWEPHTATSKVVEGLVSTGCPIDESCLDNLLDRPVRRRQG